MPLSFHVPDHSHAHAVFLETTFALNTIFATFKEFRGVVTENVNNWVQNFRARIGTLEGKTDHTSVNASSKLSEHLAQQLALHSDRQNKIYRYSCCFAVVCAILAVSILYWDQIHWCGKLCGILIAPFPTYALCLVGNATLMQLKVNRKKKVLDSYLEEYEASLPPIETLRVVGFTPRPWYTKPRHWLWLLVAAILFAAAYIAFAAFVRH